MTAVSGLEPFEMLPQPQGLTEAHDRALRRIGWALLSLNATEYRMAERHLADAIEALQEAQRIKGERR